MINNLKKIRTKKEITQQELATYADISLSQLRNIENNRSIPTIVIALKIKKALNVKNIEELFDL